MAANHMDLKNVAIFGEADGAKSLNVAANLVKLAEGHNLADVDNIAGISASDFNNAATWDKAKGLLTIKDHNAFNKIVESLESRSDTLWDQGVLKKGAVAYLNDIKPETWKEILHADSLDKVGGIETGISGHDDILQGQIADFNKSDIVREAEEAQRNSIIERMDKIREDLGIKDTVQNDLSKGIMENKFAVNMPENPDVPTLVNDMTNNIMRQDINKLFGSKGLFGFGAKNGLESADWIKAKNLPATKAGGALKEYINNLSEHSGSKPQANETTEDYIKRAIARFVSKDNGLPEIPKTTSAPIDIHGAPQAPSIPEIATPNSPQDSGPTVFGTPKAPLKPKESEFIWPGGDNNN